MYDPIELFAISEAELGQSGRLQGPQRTFRPQAPIRTASSASSGGSAESRPELHCPRQGLASPDVRRGSRAKYRSPRTGRRPNSPPRRKFAGEGKPTQIRKPSWTAPSLPSPLSIKRTSYDAYPHVAIARRDGTGDVRWLERSSCFAWHVLNASNDGATIQTDVCEQSAPAFPGINGAMPPADTLAQRLTRWEFDVTGARTIEVKRLSDEICEYPRVDERFSGRTTRHGYFACLGGPGTADPCHRGIAHYDSKEDRMRRLSFGPTHAVSEPVFVPVSEDAAEGGGWLLCIVYDEGADTSDLVPLDARDIDRGPIARARVPHRVPMGPTAAGSARGETLGRQRPSGA